MLEGVVAAALLAPGTGVHRLGLVGRLTRAAARGGGGVVPVHGRHMVAVGAVFRLQLPVAVEGVGGGAAQHLQALGGLVDGHVDDLGRVTEVILERHDVRVEAAEEEAAVALEASDLDEVVAALGVELLRVAGIARVLHLEQLAGVVEGPAVERAGERGAVVGLAPAQHRAAMAARVDQAVELALLVAGDNDGLATDVGGEVVTHVGNLALMCEVNPVALEDVLHLELEELLVGKHITTNLVTTRGRVFDQCTGQGLTHIIQDFGHREFLH